VALCDFVAASRVGRLQSNPQDVSQRTTRSQTRQTGEKGPNTSARTEKALLVTRGSAKNGRPRNLSTKSDTAADGIDVMKVPRTVTAAASSASSKLIKFVFKENMSTVLHWSSVQAFAEAGDMEMSCNQMDQQSRCPQNPTAAQVSSSQKRKSTRRSDYKHTENSKENTGGAATNKDVLSSEGHSGHSDHEAFVVSTQSNKNIIPHELGLANGSASIVPVDEAKILPQAVDENSAHGEDESHQSEVAQSFRTPGGSRRARSTVSPSITFASVRKTPKNLRNSLLLRRMSPEDGYVLSFLCTVTGMSHRMLIFKICIKTNSNFIVCCLAFTHVLPCHHKVLIASLSVSSCYVAVI